MWNVNQYVMWINSVLSDSKSQFKVGNDIVKVFVDKLYREWTVDSDYKYEYGKIWICIRWEFEYKRLCVCNQILSIYRKRGGEWVNDW